MRRRQKTQHKEVTPGKSSGEPGCARAGGVQRGKDAWALQGPPLYLGSPWRPAAQLLPTPPRPLPALHPPHCPFGPRRQPVLGGRRAAPPSPAPPALAPSLSPLRLAAARAAGAGEGAAAGCWGPARRAEARACCLASFPLQAQGLSSGTRFSWLLGLCAGTKGQQQRGCALHSVTTRRGGERRYLCSENEIPNLGVKGLLHGCLESTSCCSPQRSLTT